MPVYLEDRQLKLEDIIDPDVALHLYLFAIFLIFLLSTQGFTLKEVKKWRSLRLVSIAILAAFIIVILILLIIIYVKL